MIPTATRPERLGGRRLPTAARPVGHSHWILGSLVALSYLGVAILRPGLPQNLAYIDPIIAMVCFVALLSMRRLGSPATLTGLRALPWIWLILLGSFLGLATVGIPFWATSSLIRTCFALLTFFCFWHLIQIQRLENYALFGTGAGLGLTAVTLLIEKFRYRGEAFFEHANYAGHYCILAGVTLVALSPRKWVKVLAIVGMGIAIWQTSSFGAIAMLLAMLAVIVIRSFKRSTAILAVGLIVLVVGALFLASPASDSINSSSSWNVNGELSSDRLDKSQGSRTQLWGQALTAFAASPLGVGPDGVHQRGIGEYNGHSLEIHNDALGYLVERGVLGLIGYLGLWVVIWRSSRPGGFARVLIVGSLVAGIFRETMHYRHMWLLIALAMAVDWRRSTEESEAAAAGTTDDAVTPPTTVPFVTPSWS